MRHPRIKHICWLVLLITSLSFSLLLSGCEPTRADVDNVANAIGFASQSADIGQLTFDQALTYIQTQPASPDNPGLSIADLYGLTPEKLADIQQHSGKIFGEVDKVQSHVSEFLEAYRAMPPPSETVGGAAGMVVGAAEIGKAMVPVLTGIDPKIGYGVYGVTTIILSLATALGWRKSSVHRQDAKCFLESAEDIVRGGEGFKTAIKSSSLSEGDQTVVLETFAKQQQKAQLSVTQDLVSEIKQDL